MAAKEDGFKIRRSKCLFFVLNVLLLTDVAMAIAATSFGRNTPIRFSRPLRSFLLAIHSSNAYNEIVKLTNCVGSVIRIFMLMLFFLSLSAVAMITIVNGTERSGFEGCVVHKYKVVQELATSNPYKLRMSTYEMFMNS